MLRSAFCIGAALVSWLAVAGTSPAVTAGPQERDQARSAERQERDAPRGDARALQPRRAKSVLGSKVSIRGDISIGTVDDIIFSDDGYIDYLVVLNEGKYVLVPWEAATFNFERRIATVEITQERFREIPTFTVERIPNVYEPAYRQRIYTFYGIERVPERRFIDRPGRGRAVPPGRNP